MTIPSRSERSIRDCMECVHYIFDDDSRFKCQFEPAFKIKNDRKEEYARLISSSSLFNFDIVNRSNLYRDAGKQVNKFVPCIHHFTEDELKELGESMS